MTDLRKFGDYIHWDRAVATPSRMWDYAFTYVIKAPNICDHRFGPLLRNFHCKCCRLLQDKLLTANCLDPLDTIERFADGKAAYRELVVAKDEAKRIARTIPDRKATRSIRAAVRAVMFAGSNNAYEGLMWGSSYLKAAGLSNKDLATVYEEHCIEWFRAN